LTFNLKRLINSHKDKTGGSPVIDIIKKYSTDSKLIKIAEEILSEFGHEKDMNKKPNLNLEKLSIHNFGNLEKFEIKFDKEINFFEGDRNSGKSWAMESPLYLMTGSSRDRQGIIGEYDNKMLGELLLNKDVQIRWNKTEKSGKVETRKGDFIVSSSTKDLSRVIKNYTNIDIELMTSLFYYSPRLSFQFSRSLPYQIEELLIKVANLDIWLELESSIKKFKKKEEEKIFELQGTIGYISEQDLDKDELKEKIDENKKQINEIDQKFIQIKIPEIWEYREKYQKIENQVKQRNDMQQREDEINNLKEQLDNAKKGFEETQNAIKKLDFDEKEIEDIEKDINIQTEKLNDIKNQGQLLKKQIEDNEKIVDKSICPILNKECQDLKENSKKIVKGIYSLESQKQNLLKEYEISQKGMSLYQFSKSGYMRKKEKYIKYKLILQSNQQSILNFEESLKISLGKVKKMVIPGTLEEDLKNLENLNKQIENIDKEVKEKESQKNKLIEQKTDILAENKDLESKFKNIEQMAKFIKEKNRLDNRRKLLEELIKMCGKKEIPKKESRNILSKLNKNINTILDKLTGGHMTQEINDDFEMKVNLKKGKKALSPKTISEGEELVLNLSFVLGLGLFKCKDKLPIFWVDDVCAFQPDEKAKEIINGIISLQKEGKIKQLFLASNRLKNLRINGLADRIFVFDNGKYKIKKVEE
jgi:DNA repair exonuclease SbcCD ATPase subunit